ncbi:MAG: hypothetical protein JKY90_03560 [Gammaproteobacteria bacterium]|nr:hypothetical protein [Gammaproteobacteria bacterium]
MSTHSKWRINRYSVTLLIAATIMIVLDIGQAEAVPAFGRKYEVNCVLCHTNEPRLSLFGQQFKENGYQMPGSADGSSTRKIVLEGEQGPVTLDTLSNIMAVRIRGDIFQPSFNETTAAIISTDTRDGTDVRLPTIINLFFAGTARKDISYFLEGEYNEFEEDPGFGFERAFLQFSNLGGQSVANIQVGNFDPSGLFSFPTHRQQLNPIPAVADTTAFPPAIGRIPLLPLAFSSKFFGLTRGGSFAGEEGFAILPFEPLLYNAPSQNGIAIHGRPFGLGSGFMYQFGVAQNDKATALGDRRDNRYDTYVMGRYDWYAKGGAAMQVSAFYYNAPDAAFATLNPGAGAVFALSPTDIDRYGIGARAQWGKFDVYATYIVDEIDQPVFAAAPLNTSQWDTTGSGFSAEMDWRFHKQWMLGVRYDWMAPGGLSRLPAALNQSQLNINASFLSPIIKYYPSPNIGLYARTHFNLESSQPNPVGGGVEEHPATNLENIFSVGVDMAF